MKQFQPPLPLLTTDDLARSLEDIQAQPQFRYGKEITELEDLHQIFLHNTKKLLKIYRTLVYEIEQAIPVEVPESLEEVIAPELLNAHPNLTERYRTQTVWKTAATEVNSRMTANQILCLELEMALSKLEGYPNSGEKEYRILYELYINPIVRKRYEVEDILHMTNKTLQRYEKDAIQHLSNILWGAKNKETELWQYHMAALLQL